MGIFFTWITVHTHSINCCRCFWMLIKLMLITVWHDIHSYFLSVYDWSQSLKEALSKADSFPSSHLSIYSEVQGEPINFRWPWLCTWHSKQCIHRLNCARNWMKKSLKITCWPGLSYPDEVRSQLKVCYTLSQETSRGLPAAGANWKSQNSSLTKIEQKHEHCLTCLRCCSSVVYSEMYPVLFPVNLII